MRTFYARAFGAENASRFLGGFIYRNGKELWGTTVFYDIAVTYRAHCDFVHETDGKGEHFKKILGRTR